MGHERTRKDLENIARWTFSREIRGVPLPGDLEAEEIIDKLIDEDPSLIDYEGKETPLARIRREVQQKFEKAA